MGYRWNVNRLVELEEQIGKFKVVVGDSMRKREKSPNQSIEGKINWFNIVVRESQGRLYWPKMNQGV